MDLLALFALASALGAAVVAGVIVWTSARAANSAITRHFKASEHILETGEPPPNWLTQRKDPLANLDELIHFFESCRFFEDEFAREQLLAQLADVREDWSRRY
ncbi:MAG: hypothetical protein OXG92_02750 [Chloroflexi bacterium]|nr:hypothetical protein [Chloroflexota bacterium]MCY3583123.1 hypothetical protein [Chloroflexota bacterium]MCY3715372.1 hypothetical protein [Chloroflexota bacterium]MDE2649581.1 hypothetical protein [Chloroflexota bacterium]MXX51216.1 hypothetical protein [Chloroflexota bacterium]